MLKFFIKTISVILALIIIWLSAWALGAFSNTNENYKAEVKQLLSSALTQNTPKNEIIALLNKKSFKHHLTSLKDSKNHTKYENRESECGQSERLFARIKLGSVLNPVETSAAIYFTFNENNLLIDYSINIRHSFL
ncbi:hypothetical protein [sulfur-oxidizing endosymbiont of Gigantopelta aegis]|uniref:hypothetical protein n=1 Tax=sulfur-oxidizing endosymbiont of Gigantopelta aegis TaxID=2794934 RepID=UPI0018DEC89B|nr:hypothetical protein [sulfur-oxidizing endosymbiont of Gigantopelta aegis]